MDYKGLWVRVAELLLAVPLSILGTMLTPAVQRWYNSSSRYRRLKRIVALGYLHKRASAEWLFTPAEWEAYRAAYKARQSFFLILFVGTGFLSVMMIQNDSSSVLPLTGIPEAASKLVRLVSLRVGFSFLLPYLVSGWALVRIRSDYRDVRRLHAVEGRKEIEDEMKRLHELLAEGAAAGG